MENVLVWLKSYLNREIQEKQTFYVFSIPNFASDLRKCLNDDQIKNLIKELKNE